MIRLADASAEASKVEHCSTFAASHASKAPLRFPQCSSAKSDVTPFKVNGEAFNAHRCVDGPLEILPGTYKVYLVVLHFRLDEIAVIYLGEMGCFSDKLVGFSLNVLKDGLYKYRKCS